MLKFLRNLFARRFVVEGFRVSGSHVTVRHPANARRIVRNNFVGHGGSITFEPEGI